MNIVKHLEKYPNDGLVQAFQNVFAFDKYDEHLIDNLTGIFHQHGIPIGLFYLHISLNHQILKKNISGIGSKIPIQLSKAIQLPNPIEREHWNGINKEAAIIGQVDKVVKELVVKGGWDVPIEIFQRKFTFPKRDSRVRSFSEEIFSFDLPKGFIFTLLFYHY